ncbi:MAG: hypothetical protein H5U38_08120, partial [Calditrichaeota bacterium]|nr:hypothetical protein [Calditrichota bacterium]
MGKWAIRILAGGAGVVMAGHLAWVHGGEDLWTASGPRVFTAYRIAQSPVRPEVLLVHTGEGGLFMTSDTGHTWRQLLADPWLVTLVYDAWDFGDIVISPHVKNPLFYGVWGAVYRSWDGGQTWQATSSFPAAVPTVILVDPKRAGGLLVGNESPVGVVYSQDGGNHWVQLSAGLRSGRVRDLVGDATADTLFAATRDGVYRRPWPRGGIGGDAWTDISGELAGQIASALLPPVPGGRGLVVGTPDALYLGDGWGGWRKLEGIPLADRYLCPRALASGRMAPQALYVGTSKGLFFTIDGGSSWEERSSGLGNTGILCISPVDSTRLFLGTCDGLYATYDGGRRWYRRGSELVASQCPFLCFDTTKAPSRVWVATDRAGLYYSDDHGETWTDAEADDGIVYVADMAVGPGVPARAYVAALQSTGAPRYLADVLMASSDGGQSWYDATGSLAGLFPRTVVAHPQDPDLLYCGTRLGGFFRSSDGGRTWQAGNEGLPQGEVELVMADPSDPSLVYAGVRSSSIWEPHGLYKSTDGGQSWSCAQPSLLSEEWHFVSDLAINPANSRTLFATLALTQGVYKSNNQGLTWQAANRGITLGDGHLVLSVCMDPVDTNIVYAAGT